MQTIKTAIVVVLLLFVLYGGYIAMNGTNTPLKAELDFALLDQTIPDVSGPGPIPSSNSGNTASAFDMFTSTPSKGFAANTNASPFANSNTAESSVPPAFPASINPTLQPAPLLTPPSGISAMGNSLPSTLPPLANTPSSAFNPALPQSNDEKFPPSLRELSNPVSTNTPNFGMNTADSKNPGGFPASATEFPTSAKSLPPLDLSNDPGSLSNSIGSSPISVQSSASKSYENAKELAIEQIDRRNLKDALATLSVFYNAPEITTEQRQDLLDLLDALSREVVFSRQHLLEMPYVVAPGETLEQVAKQYDLPPEILARINSIDTTTPLRSGEKLKVVPGPFRAEVDLAKNELTLFLGDLYAGRYPVTFGAEPSPSPGVFQVIDKQKNRNYYGNGVQIQHTDPRNPFGGYWIDLGQDLCIHGSSSGGQADSKLGCISLSPLDANDIFGMLSRGSQVTIRR